jgi:acetolactate synthase-1/2/3 large subunit
MKKRVADIIMELLAQNGVKDCFAVVGGGAMHLDNALAMHDGINKYFNHHEQACAIAAEAYARLSGRIPLVCVTSGPGGTNALTGVMGAYQDSISMLVVSGQVRYDTTVEDSGLDLRYRGMQEFDIVSTVSKMTKYATMIKDPLAIKQELQKCIDIALEGRRGPVWMDVPLNIQSAVIEEDDCYGAVPLPKAPKISSEEIAWLQNEIAEAQRPVLLAGNGITNSGNLQVFRKFVDVLKIPTLSAALSGDVMYREHPLYFGNVGLIGNRAANFLVQNADLIVVLGSSLGYKVTGFAQELFAPNAKIVAIDIDADEMKKPGLRIARFLQSDLSDFFKDALPYMHAVNIRGEWLEYCGRLRERFSPFEAVVAENIAPDDRVPSYYFWKEYARYESEDGISALGNNTANSAKLQIGVEKKNQRIIANINCGSMGADLPEAIGAAVASGKQVICLTGDGSIMMNLQELQTIKHYGLPVKVVVFSNDGYNAMRQTCKNFFGGLIVGSDPGSGISFPDLADVANTFGFAYRCCGTNAEVAGSLQWLFDTSGLLLLEVKQKLDDPVVPKVMSRMAGDGTMLSPALQDMHPFLNEAEREAWMLGRVEKN